LLFAIPISISVLFLCCLALFRRRLVGIQSYSSVLERDWLESGLDARDRARRRPSRCAE
jgi:hypothetical protein